MQEQIGHQLIIMEVAGHEEMQTPDVCQVNASHLEDQRGKEGNQVDDQQILRDGWYAEHHKIYDLLIYYLRFWPCGAISAAKLRKISCFSPKNGGNTTFFH